MKKNGPDVRFRKGGRHEFYVFGHLAQAGMAWKRSTGDDRLFQASLRFADLLCDLFGSKPLPYDYQSKRPDRKYEHPNHEMAMVELYRMTGNRRYLDFAAHTLDCYKFWSFPEVWGHCVQENLLLCGGADVYLEIGKSEMLQHLHAMWTDITERKAYLTGGVGDGSPFESYGAAYSLPNEKNYCETCAAISKVFFDERMLLATGKAKYADDMERTFYNAALSGVSLKGTEYFYENPMEINIGGKDQGKHGRRNERKPYFNCSCCAPNLLRLLGSLQQYLFTASPDGVQAQLYGCAELKTRLDSGAMAHLRETTDYPLSGSVQFEILADGKYDLSLRIPQWTEGTKVGIAINGKPGPNAKAGGYAKISKVWKAGDKVILEFDMKPRLITGREWVGGEKGKLALMRGPLVYCLESPDNEQIDIFNLRLTSNCTFTEEPTKDLGGAVRLNGQAWDEARKNAVQVSAIPYHLWANRGASSMRIWVPAREQTLTGE
ncbi:MAG: glycoside hydrolase family 127 protein [Candidatus Sumerlaeota bacterium]|nr:glycoside hydrolase family 127 protein [Candidatus Sumerlaeota bacterium]